MHMLILEQGNAFGNRLHVQSELSLCSLELKGHRNQPLHDFGNGKHTIIVVSITLSPALHFQPVYTNYSNMVRVTIRSCTQCRTDEGIVKH